MIRTAKSFIIFGVILLTVGISFAIPQADRDSSTANKNTLVCGKNKDKETRDYQKNLKEQKRLTKTQAKFFSDPNVVNNTCKNLAKKKQLKCHIDVRALRIITRDLVKINQRISEYELCYLAPKCGNAINNVFFAPPSENLCSSGSMRGDISFDLLTLGANSEPVWKWECSNPQGNIMVSCSAQSMIAYGVLLGEWGTCVDGVQYRTQECVFNYNQDIIIPNCNGGHEISRACDIITNVSIQSSYYSDVLDAANLLAYRRVIIDYASNPTQYLWNNLINKQDLLAMTLKAMKLAPAADFQCQNIFGDISDPSVCAVAETALANGLIARRTNEEGISLFRGTDHMTIYEMFVLTMKSQCVRPESSSVAGVQSTAGNLGITNAGTLNMTKAASRGDAYLSLATFIYYFNWKVATDPNLFDASIVGCADRIDRNDEDVLCSLFPDLCQ